MRLLFPTGRDRNDANTRVILNLIENIVKQNGSQIIRRLADGDDRKNES